MQSETLKIEFDGSEIDGLYSDVVSLEVDLDDDLAGMFRLNLALLLQADGSWTRLDDERLTLWKKVVISVGLGSDPQQLMKGYVTHIRPSFGPGLAQCRLEICGMDASVLMDREEKLKDWPSKKDSDIASEIFATYGLTAEVEDTAIVHDELVSTIIQRETDIQFLKRLASRNGYECYVDGDTGVFRTPQLGAEAQPVLSVHFGDETNVTRLQLEVNAQTSAGVSMFQVDRDTKEVLTVSSNPGRQEALGASPSDSFLGSGTPAARVYVGKAVTTGTPEMEALCQGLCNEGEWFVTAEGEVAANQYGNVLKLRAPVTIKGIGETYSGIYYVTRVEHVFNADGYVQRFRVKRNGLMPTGAEVFSGADGLLGSLL